MPTATNTRKKTRRIPVAVLGVIVILVSLSLIPPVSAFTKSVPIDITANFNPAKPAALFIGVPTEGLAPLTVQFTDVTPVTPNSYLWDFGDGTFSTAPNPLPHTYQSGVYNVSLSVTFAPGGASTKTEIKNYIHAYTSTHTLTFNTPGLTGTTFVTFDGSVFEGTGGSWSYDPQTGVLTITYPPGSDFKQLVITLISPNVNGNIITGTVDKATLETKDLAGSLIAGTEQHTIVFYLNAIPLSGSIVETDTIDHIDPQNMAAFELLAAQSHLTLLNTYYEMFVSTTIPASTITGMGIKMAIPSSYNNPDITIIGIDPQGNAHIIPTDTIISPGGFVIFNAPSFTGYDTFGLAKLGGLNPAVIPHIIDYGGGGSDSPGSSIGGGPMQGENAAPIQENAPVQEAAPVQQQGIEALAPAEEGAVASSTSDFSMDGDVSTDTSSDGKMFLKINRTAVEKNGAKIIIENNTVTIDHPLFSIFIACVQVTESNGWIYGEDVLIILPSTKPVEGTISGQTVSAWLDTQLDQIGHGTMITTTLSEPINEEHNKGFENALKNEGLDIQDIDYTMTVTKTNITTSHSSNITMTASPAWVEANGGVDSIYIVRLGDDGKQQVLKTRFIGYDEKGNMIFEAISPDGLSVFGLVSAKATEEKLAEDKNATVVAVSKPAMTTNVGMFEWMVSLIVTNPIVLVVVVVLIAVAAYFGWWRRRL
jgi:PKD repeat protein